MPKIVTIKRVNSQLPLQRLFLLMWPFWLSRADKHSIMGYFRDHRWTQEEKSHV